MSGHMKPTLTKPTRFIRVKTNPSDEEQFYPADQEPCDPDRYPSHYRIIDQWRAFGAIGEDVGGPVHP